MSKIFHGAKIMSLPFMANCSKSKCERNQAKFEPYFGNCYEIKIVWMFRGFINIESLFTRFLLCRWILCVLGWMKRKWSWPIKMNNWAACPLTSPKGQVRSMNSKRLLTSRKERWLSCRRRYGWEFYATFFFFPFSFMSVWRCAGSVRTICQFWGEKSWLEDCSYQGFVSGTRHDVCPHDWNDSLLLW